MKPYASDLSDVEWAILEPLIPPAKHGGRPRSVNMRHILNGIFYVLRSGGAWRLLPHEYPAWSTVYDYFRKWRQAGVWEQLTRTLRERLRVQAGRKATPSAGIIDTDVYKLSRAPMCTSCQEQKNLPFFCLSIRLETLKPRMLTYVKTCEAQRNSP